MQIFLLDGIAYNVHVMELKRSFSVMDTDKSGRTQNGEMYRDIIGTFYNYTMTIRERDGDHVAMEALWEAASAPETSHVCVFPYGQTTMTQKMYVTSAEQSLTRMEKDRNHWGDITLSFVAMSPKVVP